ESVEMRVAHGDLTSDIVRYVREVRREAGDDRIINVIIPETIQREGLSHVTHTWQVQRMKAALVAEAGVVVTNVAHHPGYEALEPVAHAEGARSAMEGWRHVAVVLVSGVHNATARSLRYARSLRADELHC